MLKASVVPTRDFSGMSADSPPLHFNRGQVDERDSSMLDGKSDVYASLHLLLALCGWLELHLPTDPGGLLVQSCIDGTHHMGLHRLSLRADNHRDDNPAIHPFPFLRLPEISGDKCFHRRLAPLEGWSRLLFLPLHLLLRKAEKELSPNRERADREEQEQYLTCHHKLFDV